MLLRAARTKCARRASSRSPPTTSRAARRSSSPSRRVARGHTKRVRVPGRLANKHRPSSAPPQDLHPITRFATKHKTAVRRKDPPRVASASSAASPSKPLRMSVAPAASHTFTPAGSAIIAAPEDRSHARALPYPHARTPQCYDRCVSLISMSREARLGFEGL